MPPILKASPNYFCKLGTCPQSLFLKNTLWRMQSAATFTGMGLLDAEKLSHIPILKIFSSFGLIPGLKLRRGGWPGFRSSNKGDFPKKWSPNKFRKIAYIQWFSRLFHHFMHNCAMKSSTFTKLGNFSLKYRNFKKRKKNSAPAAPKIGHWT